MTLAERLHAARAVNLGRLPIQPTAFVGRDRELADVRDLLSRDEVRLVTLTGPGGAGKTRLAVRAAADCAPAYADGVSFVALAPVRQEDLIAATVADALGLAEQPGVPPDEALADHLGERELLLLLDNLEQFTDGVPLIGDLLALCPGLTVLAISREPLRLAGEWEYPLPPMEASEAVRLFVERARAVKPGFESDPEVAEICRRLDALPLAIELAAARVRALSTGQILARLDRRLPLLVGGPRDVPERQRTLRAAIDWSHDLLRPHEQDLFARLAVFAGGFTLDAAEPVCDADLETLESLLDKSLVRHDTDRYTMLETIREYAVEQLDARGERTQLAERHSAYFLELAERGAPHLHSANSDRMWLTILEAERDNLRAALQWLVGQRLGEEAQRLAGALCPFWHDRGPVAEAYDAMTRTLALPASSATRAVVLTRGSLLAGYGGEHVLAAAWAAEGLPLARSAGDGAGVVAALTTLAVLAFAQHRDRDGMPMLEEALDVARETGDDWAVAVTIASILTSGVEIDPARAAALTEEAAALRGVSASARSMVELCRGFLAEQAHDYDTAMSLYRESIALASEIGFDKACAPLLNLGFLALRLGDVEEARDRIQEAVVQASSSGARGMVAGGIAYLSLVAAADGDLERAALLRGAIETYRDTVGEVPLTEFIDGTFDGYLDAARRAAGKAWDAAFDRGRAMSLDEIRATIVSDRPGLDPYLSADGTVTIMFSDIEGSTALTERLGDRRWLEVLRAHDAIVGREVERHRGGVVKGRGDGFMLAFRRPDDALGCAIDIQRAFDRYNAVNPGAAIRVRIGLHHGTALKHQQDYYGRDVNLAARIADRAAGGQILATAVIREMAGSTTGARFVPSGELELKGLSGKHAAYAVLWDASPATAGPAG